MKCLCLGIQCLMVRRRELPMAKVHDHLRGLVVESKAVVGSKQVLLRRESVKWRDQDKGGLKLPSGPTSLGASNVDRICPVTGEWTESPDIPRIGPHC